MEDNGLRDLVLEALPSLGGNSDLVRQMIMALFTPKQSSTPSNTINTAPVGQSSTGYQQSSVPQTIMDIATGAINNSYNSAKQAYGQAQNIVKQGETAVSKVTSQSATQGVNDLLKRLAGDPNYQAGSYYGRGY